MILSPSYDDGPTSRHGPGSISMRGNWSYEENRSRSGSACWSRRVRRECAGSGRQWRGAHAAVPLIQGSRRHLSEADHPGFGERPRGSRPDHRPSVRACDHNRRSHRRTRCQEHLRQYLPAPRHFRAVLISDGASGAGIPGAASFRRASRNRVIFTGNGRRAILLVSCDEGRLSFDSPLGHFA